MEISDELIELAKIFESKGKKLYIVGGFVRDSLLNLEANNPDIDLCSEVTPRELIEMLMDSRFDIENINAKVGVMAIIGRGGKRYEHATFRVDVYDGQSHSPVDVKFIRSLEEDAKRRDFRINAVYYDILTDEIIDPLGGVYDIGNKIVSTTRNARFVYEDDPERIIRALRLAVQLGFSIPAEESEVLVSDIERLQYLSTYRIRREFEKMLFIDKIYKDDEDSGKLNQMLSLIGELGLWDLFLPGVYDAIAEKDKAENGTAFIDDLTRGLEKVDSSIRLEYIMLRLTNLEIVKGGLKDSDFEGVLRRTVEYNLGEDALGYSKEEMKNIVMSLSGAYLVSRTALPAAKVRGFVFEHRFVFDKVMKLTELIPAVDEKHEKVKQKTFDLITRENESIKSEKYPLTSDKLNIESEELIRNFPQIKLDKIPDLREGILIRMVVMKKSNIKDDLIFLATKEIEENKQFYLD